MTPRGDPTNDSERRLVANSATFSSLNVELFCPEHLNFARLAEITQRNINEMSPRLSRYGRKGLVSKLVAEFTPVILHGS